MSPYMLFFTVLILLLRVEPVHLPAIIFILFWSTTKFIDTDELPLKLVDKVFDWFY